MEWAGRGAGAPPRPRPTGAPGRRRRETDSTGLPASAQRCPDVGVSCLGRMRSAATMRCLGARLASLLAPLPPPFPPCLDLRGRGASWPRLDVAQKQVRT
eukprot:4776029-Pyramimonas_sp.AAC.1